MRTLLPIVVLLAALTACQNAKDPVGPSYKVIDQKISDAEPCPGPGSPFPCTTPTPTPTPTVPPCVAGPGVFALINCDPAPAFYTPTPTPTPTPCAAGPGSPFPCGG